MVHYLQRERNSPTAIPLNSIVQFDTPVALSSSGSPAPSADFQYLDNGYINILKPGTYAVFWFVVGKTGFATNGQSYQLRKYNYDAITPGFEDSAKSTNHIKVSSTPGFAIVIVSADEITEHNRATIALFNAADSSIEPTFFSPKAGILIFGIDLESLETRISGIEGEITNIFQQVATIYEFVHLSDVINMPSPTPELAGLGVAVIHSGYTYNFWGTGSLNHVQTLNAGQTYYLLPSSEFEPLTYYQGEATIGTLWIETPGGTMISFPVRFDGTGIFFRPVENFYNLPIGTTFKFTQALILVSSS